MREAGPHMADELAKLSDSGKRRRRHFASVAEKQRVLPRSFPSIGEHLADVAP